MNSVNSFEFNCDCGFRFRVRPDQGGKGITCPNCHKRVIVPSLQITKSSDVAIDLRPSVADMARQVALKLQLVGGPVSFTTLLSYLAIGWLGVSLACVVLSLAFGSVRLIAAVVFLVTTVAVVHQIWLLLQARRRVLSRKQISLMWGLVHLIAWDPTEGVLVLRNKNVVFSDDDLADGRGGVRFVCPILGEEIGLRVPLEVQTLDFADHDVLTREYLRLSIRGTLRWRITDIRNFYLLISRELRSVSDLNHKESVLSTSVQSTKGDDAAQGPLGQLVFSAIQWLRGLAEAQTRTVVGKVSSGLLLADRIAADVPEIRSAGLFGSGGNEFGEGTETLGDLLQKSLRVAVANYGIAIEDVALREVKFPEEIMAQCIDAARAAYLPLLGHRKAEMSTATLRREADILGKEAIGTREIVANAPPVALADFLANVLAKTGHGAPQTAVDAAVPAALTVALASQLLPPNTQSASQPKS